MNLVDEVLQHFFGVREIGDDAVLHRPHGGDVPRGPSEHLLCLRTDREHDFLAAAWLALHSDDRGFVEDDSPRLDVNQGIGGAKVDR